MGKLILFSMFSIVIGSCILSKFGRGPVHTQNMFDAESAFLCTICIGIFSINTKEYENLSFFYDKLKMFLLTIDVHEDSRHKGKNMSSKLSHSFYL